MEYFVDPVWKRGFRFIVLLFFLMGLLQLTVFSMLFHRSMPSLVNKTDKSWSITWRDTQIVSLLFSKEHEATTTTPCNVSELNTSSFHVFVWRIFCFNYLFISFNFPPGKQILFTKWFLQLQIKFSTEKIFPSGKFWPGLLQLFPRLTKLTHSQEFTK